jgi:hypothetical protein
VSLEFHRGIGFDKGRKLIDKLENWNEEQGSYSIILVEKYFKDIYFEQSINLKGYLKSKSKLNLDQYREWVLSWIGNAYHWI